MVGRDEGKNDASYGMVVENIHFPLLSSSESGVVDHALLASVDRYRETEVVSVNRMYRQETEFDKHRRVGFSLEIEVQGIARSHGCGHLFISQSFARGETAGGAFGAVPFVCRCRESRHRLVGEGSLDLVEDRQAPRSAIHDAVPLSAVGKSAVVCFRQRCDAVVCGIALFPLRLSMAGKLGVEKLEVHLCGCLHGIFHELEIFVHVGSRHAAPNLLDLVGDARIALHAFEYLLFAERKIGDARVLGVALFGACVAHVLGLVDEGKPVVLGHEREYVVGTRTELTVDEAGKVLFPP